MKTLRLISCMVMLTMAIHVTGQGMFFDETSFSSGKNKKEKGYFNITQIRVKQYNIFGTSMLRDDNTLIVVNQQGLFFYDISDLENIVQLNP